MSKCISLWQKGSGSARKGGVSLPHLCAVSFRCFSCGTTLSSVSTPSRPNTFLQLDSVVRILFLEIMTQHTGVSAGCSGPHGKMCGRAGCCRGVDAAANAAVKCCGQMHDEEENEENEENEEIEEMPR